MNRTRHTGLRSALVRRARQSAFGIERDDPVRQPGSSRRIPKVAIEYPVHAVSWFEAVAL
jgi:hypothetical protein